MSPHRPEHASPNPYPEQGLLSDSVRTVGHMSTTSPHRSPRRRRRHPAAGARRLAGTLATAATFALVAVLGSQAQGTQVSASAAESTTTAVATGAATSSTASDDSTTSPSTDSTTTTTAAPVTSTAGRSAAVTTSSSS